MSYKFMEGVGVLELITVVILLALVLIVHEVGHLVMLRRYNVRVSQFGIGFGLKLFAIGQFHVHLLPIGAYISPHRDDFEKLSPYLKYKIAMGGPVANLINALLFYGAALTFGSASAEFRTLSMLAEFHSLVAAFNLLPIPPLDGWAVFRYLREAGGHALSSRTLGYAERAGTGLVWGIGSFLLVQTLFNLL